MIAHPSIRLEADRRPSRRRHYLLLALLLAAGLLVYELTTQPVLAVAVICLKFGWSDFLTGYRLWRVDFDRSRARAFFWLYLGAGLLNVLFAGGLLLIGTILLAFILDRIVPGPPGRVIEAFGWSLGASAASLILSALASCWGFRCARRRGIKVWLDLMAVMPANDWPYVAVFPAARNKGEYLLGTALFTGWFLALLGFTALISLCARVVGPWITLPAIIVFFGALFLPCIIGFRGYKTAVDRFLAPTPEECWGTDVIGSIMTLRVSTGIKARLLAEIPRACWRSEDLSERP